MLIGVFHPHDPFGVMTENRVQAIVEESFKQNVQFVFFNESGIDLDQRTVDGIVFDGVSWIHGTFPFPKAIMNIRPWGPRRRSDRELIFRKLVPFTAFLIDDKWEITNMITEYPPLSPYIVPTAILQDVGQIDELFESHTKLVIKPVQGSRGAGVQAMERKDGLYGLQDGADWIWMNRAELQKFILDLNRDYLLQPYIVCLTPEGEPFDFRILVQRNGEGDWEVAIIYPRIGAKDTITSNVSISGRTEVLEPFLMRLFPDDYAAFPPRLTQLGLEIAEFIDSHYAYPLNELGIDLAIDASRRIWFYEANTCPGTLYHEKERAVLAVAYVKYIAETVSRNELSRLSSGHSFTFGLLFSSPPDLPALEAYADVARSYGIELVYFLLEDIRFRAASISGFWREGHQWVAKNFAFPDIAYNVTDQEDLDTSHTVYRPSSNLWLTSREPKGPIPSSLFFAVAGRHELLSGHLPDYVRPESAAEAKSFVDRHGFVVMKSDNASQMEDVILIQRLPTHYAVQERDYLHSLDEAQFLAFWELFHDSSYILIRQIDSKTHDGHSLHIRVYTFRRPDGTWEAIHIAPLLSLASSHAQDSLPLQVSWEWLLSREFSEETAIEVDMQIRTLACTMAERLQKANRNRIHELTLDMALDPSRGLLLVGGEFDGPQEVVHPYEIARRVIPYALSLFESKYDKASRR